MTSKPQDGEPIKAALGPNSTGDKFVDAVTNGNMFSWDDVPLQYLNDEGQSETLVFKSCGTSRNGTKINGCEVYTSGIEVVLPGMIATHGAEFGRDHPREDILSGKIARPDKRANIDLRCPPGVFEDAEDAFRTRFSDWAVKNRASLFPSKLEVMANTKIPGMMKFAMASLGQPQQKASLEKMEKSEWLKENPYRLRVKINDRTIILRTTNPTDPLNGEFHQQVTDPLLITPRSKVWVTVGFHIMVDKEGKGHLLLLARNLLFSRKQMAKRRAMTKNIFALSGPTGAPPVVDDKACASDAGFGAGTASPGDEDVFDEGGESAMLPPVGITAEDEAMLAMADSLK